MIELQGTRLSNNTIATTSSSVSQGKSRSIGGAVYLGLEARVKTDVRTLAERKGAVTCRIRNSTFLENNASNGGAIASIQVKLLSMISVDFFRNTGTQGGALYIESNGDIDPHQYAAPEHYCNGINSTFRGNAARERGGSLFLSINDGRGAAPLESSGISPVGVSSFIQSRLHKNMTRPLNNNEDDAFFEGSDFLDSAAALSGGAWHVEGGRVGCRDCIFQNNRVDQKSDGVGGSIYLKGQSAFHGRSVSLLGCNAARDGGALYSDGSVVDIIDGRIEGNTARGNGGGVYIAIPKGSRFFEDIFSRINFTSFVDNAAEIGGECLEYLADLCV